MTLLDTNNYWINLTSSCKVAYFAPSVNIEKPCTVQLTESIGKTFSFILPQTHSLPIEFLILNSFLLHRLDPKSSRSTIYENEELRLRTININAEVERGKRTIFRLSKLTNKFTNP